MSIRDRGTKKWTAIMLPEHVRGLRKIWHEEFEQREKPILDEEQINEINQKIVNASELKKAVTIKTREKGFFQQYSGRIHKADPLERYLYLKEDQGVKRIPYADIIDVSIADA